jgi:hypothetical protein
MLRSIDRSPRRRNRAVTLIEAVLYISIALALIVGGLVFFQQASTAAKTSTMVRQLSATLAETRTLIKGLNVGGVPNSLTRYLISAGAVPPDMVNGATSLSNPFGGTTDLYALQGHAAVGQMIYIDLTDVPQGVCARLLTAKPGGVGATTAVSSGYVAAVVRATAEAVPGVFPINEVRGYVMNATQAGWMCKYGSNAYNNQTTEPSSTPLSGNVAVFMIFLTDI